MADQPARATPAAGRGPTKGAPSGRPNGAATRSKGASGKAGSKADGPPPVKVVATNRRARHDFEITRTLEAGIVLMGSEIKKIFELGRTVQLKGMTLVPMRLYLKGGWAKLEIGVGRGKKLYDKRDSLKQRDTAREMARATARSDR